MNMKKAIAAALVIGTMTVAGAAFAEPHHGPRHDRGGFEPRRMERREHRSDSYGPRMERLREMSRRNRYDDRRRDRRAVFGHHGGHGPQRRRPEMRRMGRW